MFGNNTGKPQNTYGIQAIQNTLYLKNQIEELFTLILQLEPNPEKPDFINLVTEIFKKCNEIYDYYAKLLQEHYKNTMPKKLKLEVELQQDIWKLLAERFPQTLRPSRDVIHFLKAYCNTIELPILHEWDCLQTSWSQQLKQVQYFIAAFFPKTEPTLEAKIIEELSKEKSNEIRNCDKEIEDSCKDSKEERKETINDAADKEKKQALQLAKVIGIRKYYTKKLDVINEQIRTVLAKEKSHFTIKEIHFERLASELIDQQLKNIIERLENFLKSTDPVFSFLNTPRMKSIISKNPIPSDDMKQALLSLQKDSFDSAYTLLEAIKVIFEKHGLSKQFERIFCGPTFDVVSSEIQQHSSVIDTSFSIN